MATRGLPFCWRCICVYFLKRGHQHFLPYRMCCSRISARARPHALYRSKICLKEKRKSFCDMCMKGTFYLKQMLLKQEWWQISHRIWKVLSFFVRVFIYLVILYQAVPGVSDMDLDPIQIHKNRIFDPDRGSFRSDHYITGE